jgi:hypothetical protein
MSIQRIEEGCLLREVFKTKAWARDRLDIVGCRATGPSPKETGSLVTTIPIL